MLDSLAYVPNNPESQTGFNPEAESRLVFPEAKDQISQTNLVEGIFLPDSGNLNSIRSKNDGVKEGEHKRSL